MVCRADEGVPMRIMKMSVWAACAAFVLPFTLACWASAQTYTVTDLGTLGGALSAGVGINSAGQVTGISDASSDPAVTLRHAFLYSNGTMQDLGALGGRWLI